MVMEVETNTPRTMLEETECEDALRFALVWCLEAVGLPFIGHRAVQVLQRAEREREAVDGLLRRILAWCCEPDSFTRIGERVMIACTKLQISEFARMTQREIAAQTGCGRSHANKLAMDFSQTFALKGPHDRSQEARSAYKAAWRKAHEKRAKVQARVRPGQSARDAEESLVDRQRIRDAIIAAAS